jgi:sec-independent protein translocase protein TatA
MGSFSAAHWLVVLIVVFILFGKNRLSETMADFGKGIRSFREGLTADDVQPEQASSDPLPIAPLPIEQLPIEPRSPEQQS